MAFALRPKESVQKGVRRLLAKEVKSAAEQLEHSPLTNVAVHEARKHIKRGRAVLRLIRKDARGSLAANASAQLRSSGRSLSQLRDASAMVVTARGLCAKRGRRFTKAACQIVAADLARHQLQMKRRDRRLAKSALRLLRSIERSARHLNLAKSGKALRRSVERAYRRAQREMQVACSRPGESAFHDWRKRVKTLSYHLRLVSLLAPGFRRHAAALERLDDQLGREHNLQVLRSYVVRRSSGSRRSTAVRLTALAEARQQRLRRSTLRAGAKLFAESPRAFARRGFSEP